MVRASFHAAIELTSTMPATPKTVMIAVLRSARGKRISVQAFTKLSTVTDRGSPMGSSFMSASGFTALLRTKSAG